MVDTSFIPPRLYLASASPRRRELLLQIGVAHEVLNVPSPPGEDEPRHDGESASAYVIRTALDKLERAIRWVQEHQLPALPILAADTTVILDEDILGKPATGEHAAEILARLSGRCHEVRTAIALHCASGIQQAVSVTQVHMRTLHKDEIQRYCATGEPFGKAGAYGIQGSAGIFIEQIEGSYSGVMGLPVFETAALLNRAGITLP